MNPFTNLDEFYDYAARIAAVPSDGPDPDEQDQQALRQLQQLGHQAFPEMTPQVDSILNQVNKNSRVGKGRYVNPNLVLNAPWASKDFDELGEDEQVQKVEAWREQIPEYALQDPINYEDNKYFMNQLANEKLRHVQGDDTGWLADKGWRAFDAVASGIASKLGAQETADSIRAWSEENPSADGDFTSALIQGFGDVGASFAIFGAATALTGGNVAVGSAALAATTGVERFTTTYKDAIDKGLSKEDALHAGIGSLPGAAVDYFADRLVIGKVLPKNMDEILKAGSTAAKRKALGDVFKNKDLRGEAMKLSRDFFVQGASEAAGDFTAGYGAYLMTDEESFVPKNQDLAMSFLVGGVIGSTFSGYESVGDRIQNRKGRDIFAQRDKAEAAAAATANSNPNSGAGAAAAANPAAPFTPVAPSNTSTSGTTAPTISYPTQPNGGTVTIKINDGKITTIPKPIGETSSSNPDTISLSNAVSEESVSLAVFDAYENNQFGDVDPLFDALILPIPSGLTSSEQALSATLSIPRTEATPSITPATGLVPVPPPRQPTSSEVDPNEPIQFKTGTFKPSRPIAGPATSSSPTVTAEAIQRSVESLKEGEKYTDAEGKVWTRRVDARGNPIMAIDQEGGSLRYGAKDFGILMRKGLDTVAPPVAPVSTPAATPRISQQPSPNLQPRATESVPPRPTKRGQEKDDWEDQYGFGRKGGRSHNDDGTPYQPTVFDELAPQIIQALKGNDSVANTDAIGVDAGVELRAALERLLDDGWEWDAQQKRMVNPANPSEHPATGLHRLKEEEKSGSAAQATPAPVATPAAQLTIPTPPAVDPVDQQVAAFESHPNEIEKDKVIEVGNTAEVEEVVENNPEIEQTVDEIIESQEDLFTEDAMEPSSPQTTPSTVRIVIKGGQIQVIPYGTQNAETGAPYLDRTQTQEVEQVAAETVKESGINLYDGDTVDITVRPTEAGLVADPIPSVDLNNPDELPGLFRESSVENALVYIPGTSTISENPFGNNVFFATTPDLALGQGENKGVLLEFDSNFETKPARNQKPGMALSEGKEVVSNLANRDIAKSIRAVTIRPEAKKNSARGHFAAMMMAMNNSGWNKTENPDGSITFRRPPTQPAEESAPTSNQESAPEEAPIEDTQVDTEQENSAPDGYERAANAAKEIREEVGVTLAFDAAKLSPKERKGVIDKIISILKKHNASAYYGPTNRALMESVGDAIRISKEQLSNAKPDQEVLDGIKKTRDKIPEKVAQLLEEAKTDSYLAEQLRRFENYGKKRKPLTVKNSRNLNPTEIRRLINLTGVDLHSELSALKYAADPESSRKYYEKIIPRMENFRDELRNATLDHDRELEESNKATEEATPASVEAERIEVEAEATPEPVVPNEPDTYPAAVEDYSIGTEFEDGLRLQDNQLQGQEFEESTESAPSVEMPPKEDPGSEPYEWVGGELTQQTNSLEGQPWENTPVATPTAAIVESTLSEDEKQEAAIELGLESWSPTAAERFVAKMSEWLVDAKSVGAKLAALIKKVWDAIKLPSILSAVAFNLSPNVANYQAVINPTQIVQDINNYDASIAEAPTTQGTVGDIEITDFTSAPASAPAPAPTATAAPAPKSDFRGAAASGNVRTMTQWILNQKDNQGKPFVLAEKTNGLMYLFDGNGVLIKKFPALYGLKPGDTQPTRRANQTFAESKKDTETHVTPGGKFQAVILEDSSEEGFDYGRTIGFSGAGEDFSLAIHKLYLAVPSENREGRLASESAADNRISMGCINVSESDMALMLSTFEQGAFVYVMPETQEGKQLFEGFENLDLSETEKPAQKTGFRVNKRKKGMASGSIINPAGAIRKAFKVLKSAAPAAPAKAGATTPSGAPATPLNILAEAAKNAHENNKVPSFVLKARKTARNVNANLEVVKSMTKDSINLYDKAANKAEFKEELRRKYGDPIADLADQLWAHFKTYGTTATKVAQSMINKVVNKTEKRPDMLPSNIKIYDETITPIEKHGLAATAAFKNNEIPANRAKGDAELHAVTANLKSKDQKIREQAERKRDSQVKRLNRIKRLKIDDRFDTATDRIARLLKDIDPAKINRMANQHVDQFYDLVDHVYQSRTKSVTNPDLREYHQGIINTLQNFRHLIDSHQIRKMMEDYGDVMDFSGYNGAIDDLPSFAKYVNRMAEALQLDISKKRKKNDAAAKAKDAAWKTKNKANVKRVLHKHPNAESWISQMEKESGGKFSKANRDLLGVHFNYMTRVVDYDSLEGNASYIHGFELNNMYDGQPIYIPETTIPYLAKQMNSKVNFTELANLFRDPYVKKNFILEALDKLQEKVELQQTKLGRVSAVEEGKDFLLNEVMGPLLDSVNRSANEQQESVDQIVEAKEAFKETTGRDFDYNDSKYISITGRLVQYIIGRNMNSEFRKNIQNEREQIANVIGGGKKNKKARGNPALIADKRTSEKVLNRLLEGLENSDKEMEDFMATIYHRIGDGDEALGKARFDFLLKMQEITGKYTLDNKFIAQNFYKNKKGKSQFQEYANYMSRRAIPLSPERKGKDELTATAEELEDKWFQSTSVTAEPEQLKNRTNIGANAYYSDNIEYIVERSVRVAAVTANTTVERFILKERLKEGNGIYELIENDTGTQERIDFMHRWAVGITQNALHSGTPMGTLGKVVRVVKEAFIRSSLSGVHHFVSQIFAGISDYHTRTGNGAGAMEAMAFIARNSEKADAFFRQHNARVLNRSVRGEDTLDRRRMPTINPSSIANHPAIKKLDKIYSGVSNAITYSLQKGDDITAKGLVLAEYIRLMREAGHIITSVDDMDFEVVDQRLMTKANNTVELNINASDKITRADFFVDRDPKMGILRDTLLLFASHNMALSGQFSQAVRDLSDLKAMGASKEKMELQARTIGAIVVQTLAFASSRYAIGAALSGVMIGLMRDLYDDEEGKLAELELRLNHAQSTGDDVLVANAKAELSQAKAISKSINAFQERTQSWKGYFQSVLKDELGVMHFAFGGPGLPQKLIFPVVDNFNEAMYKESMGAEVLKLDKRIKAAEDRRNFTEAAKLKERKTIMEGAEYLPWHVDPIGNVGVGGITGAALQNIFTNVDEMRQAAFGLREYSFNDLAISATSVGLGQSEVTRYFRQVDKIEDDMEKRDAARLDQIKKAKTRQDEQDARKEKEALLRLLGI